MLRGLFNLYRRQMADADADADHLLWYLQTFVLVLVFLAVAAILISVSALGAIVIYPWKQPVTAEAVTGFSGAFGISLLVGAAGFAVGAFLGFLFGVPRTSTERRAHDTAERHIESNTNLEQVSDWVTKIVVGVSLVQIHRINDLLVAFRVEVDRASEVPGTGFACCLILIGASIAGFLGAYLKAKTDLMKAFGAPLVAARAALGDTAQVDLEVAAHAVLSRPMVQPSERSRAAAAKLLQWAPPRTEDANVLRLIGLAHAVLKNFPAAADALEKSSQRQPEDDRLRGMAARALALAGKRSEAAKLASFDLPAGPMTHDQLENALTAMFAQLYNLPDGYKEANRIGKRLTEEPDAARSGRLWLYFSAALGQAHAACVAAGAPHKEVELARQAVVSAVRGALRNDRAKNIEPLRMMWDPCYPNKPPHENDLESLATDPELAALLRPQAGPTAG